MTSKVKLKRCPFCGGNAELLLDGSRADGGEEWYIARTVDNKKKVKPELVRLADNLTKAVAKFQKDEGGTCQYMWSHGCHMCEFDGHCAIQTLCIAKDEYDEYRKKMRRRSRRRPQQPKENRNAN